ncbi:nitrate reductase [Spartinivicinus poritis]|uniref:Nitrate reductase n=1 Tax=Spartinivicinus poritis TaxID=2994640 RepID=A0ABT5UDJ0_9GAMM|nr:nitrate reductase [Spartinivicinus sp. A2-2]MDE1464440.1 nitrate reductase [Spartinivicinus sp. A2-2]
MTNTWVKTTCAFCGVGCGIEARVNNDKVIVRGDKQHPANFGRLCSKGMALGEIVNNKGRLLQPYIEGKTTSWQNAITKIATDFKQVVDHFGSEAIGFYLSGQLLTEDYYVANKLMKGFIGSPNIDTNSRLCMSSSVAAHKRAFGSDTVPGCYEDLEKAELIIIAGANLAWCHPVLYQRIIAAKQQAPNLKIVVIDPRKTITAQTADLHLAIEPGTDVLLFNGLLHYLCQGNKLNNHFIRQYTEGFSLALQAATNEAHDLLFLAKHLAISSDLLTQFYRWFAETDKVVTLYSQGINQSSCGTDKVNSILNCHLAMGKIGKPGCGPFSLTGQPNAMGGREVGGMANSLAAHLEFNNPQHHELLSRFWHTSKLVKQPGLKAVDLFDAVAKGKIKAIWIMGTNPVVSMPNSQHVITALKNCPLVVVSDCMLETDTNQYADILLPATDWGEKSGMVTNSERRISRQRTLVKPAGKAKPDWWIICEVAKQMGFYQAFNYENEADIFKEYAKLTAFENDALGNNSIRDLDLSLLTDLTTQEYHDFTPTQWPAIKNTKQSNNKRFFADGKFYTQTTKAQFITVSYKPPVTKTNSTYPLILNTGRIRDQWHTMTRTSFIPKLCTHISEPYVHLNPLDATTFSIKHDELVQLTSNIGTLITKAKVSEQILSGQVFMPMHWTRMLASSGQVSQLINPNVDPFSGQPESKYTPVTISPWQYNCEAVVVVRKKLILKHFDYWTKQHIKGGYLYRLASKQSPETFYSKLITQLKPDSASSRLAFYDKTEQEFRYGFINGPQLHACVFIAPRLNHFDLAWLNDLLTLNLQPALLHRLIANNKTNSLVNEKILCACKQVSQKIICNTIRQQQLDCTAAVSQATLAGSVCGSCIPEIQILLDTQLLSSNSNSESP